MTTLEDSLTITLDELPFDHSRKPTSWPLSQGFPYYTREGLQFDPLSSLFLTSAFNGKNIINNNRILLPKIFLEYTPFMSPLKSKELKKGESTEPKVM